MRILGLVSGGIGILTLWYITYSLDLEISIRTLCVGGLALGWAIFFVVDFVVPKLLDLRIIKFVPQWTMPSGQAY